VILLLCDNIRRGVLRVSTVNYVYNNTEAESPLRLFIAEYFTHVNPLSSSLTESWNVEKTKFYKTEWIKLVADGGDFMREVAEFRLHNDSRLLGVAQTSGSTLKWNLIDLLHPGR
jgi:hypothetical protein